jgi:hypothetical protein
MWKLKRHTNRADKESNAAMALLGFEVALTKSDMECTDGLVLNGRRTDRRPLGADQNHPRRLGPKPFGGTIRLQHQRRDCET